MRVAVANDYELVVAGVAALLQRAATDIEVVDLVTGPEAPERPVDVVLFDTYGRDGAALDQIARLKRDARVGRVVVYTLSWSDALVRESLACGADGVLGKALSSRELCEALGRVLSGDQVVERGPTQARPGSAPERTWPGAHLGLTERESEVLVLVGRGMSNIEVAAALHVGVNTVKTHLRGAYRKAGVKNRAQAAAFVLGSC